MNNQQQEYNKLLATLRVLSIEELLLLFIEAKTGSQEDIDRVPVDYLEMAKKLGKMLDIFYADRQLNNLFLKND